jgi:putative acetyltransferase
VPAAELAPSGVTVRAEAPSDGPQIAEVVARAFGSPNEARLVDAIRASPNFVPDWSLVAISASRVVGHVMVSYVALVDGPVQHRVPSLSPLAVAPDAQGAGIGSALVRAVVQRVDEAKEPLVVLEGDPRYYGRFGFEHATPNGISITLPGWAPPEAAQVLRLRNYDPGVRGHVRYPPAFDDVLEH